MYKKGKYLCSKCGKDCGNPPALKLHEAYCIGKNKESREVSQENQDQDKKEKKCQHEWRILNRNNQAEARAIEDGYIKVCEKCQEIK
jgi:hypothetical protein